MSNLYLDIFTSGLHANRPLAPAAGISIAFYYETDTAQLFYWTGSAWSAVSTASAPASATVVGPVKGDNSTVSIAVDGTISVAVATAAHAGAVKGGQNSVNIDANGVLSANGYCFPGATSQYASSVVAAATQGNQFTPSVNMTIDQVTAAWFGAGTAGHHYVCTIASLDATRHIVAVLGTVTVVGTGGAQDLVYNFAPALALVAGTSYAIVITDTDAATAGTTNNMGGIGAASAVYPMYGLIPSKVSTNDQRITLAKNTALVANDQFTATGGTAAIGIRAQF